MMVLCQASPQQPVPTVVASSVLVLLCQSPVPRPASCAALWWLWAELGHRGCSSQSTPSQSLRPVPLQPHSDTNPTSDKIVASTSSKSSSLHTSLCSSPITHHMFKRWAGLVSLMVLTKSSGCQCLSIGCSCLWFWFVMSFVRFAFCGSDYVKTLLVRIPLGTCSRRCFPPFRPEPPLCQNLVAV